MTKPLHFLDGTLFANDYIRVVHGGRGDYIELSEDQIKVELVSNFNQVLPDKLTDEKFFYYWLIPEGRTEKVYWQVKPVTYADYRRGLYYIAPKLIKEDL